MYKYFYIVRYDPKGELYIDSWYELPIHEDTLEEYQLACAIDNKELDRDKLYSVHELVSMMKLRARLNNTSLKKVRSEVPLDSYTFEQFLRAERERGNSKWL